MKAPRMIKKAQAGFTLIELMIVVAIIGILAAVAIPAYQNYTIKAKVGSAISQVSGLKNAILDCITDHGGVADSCDTQTDDNKSGILTFQATKEVASAAVTDGVITLTFATGIGANIDGQTFTVTPNHGVDKANVTWTNAPGEGLTNEVAKEVIIKNNPPTTTTTTTTGGTTPP